MQRGYRWVGALRSPPGLRAVVAPCAVSSTRQFSGESGFDLEVARVINLSAGCAPLPIEVLQKAQREFVEFRGNDGKARGLSISEMGYRTNDFYEMIATAEERFRELMSIPDTHEVHFFNGGATLQFAALPMNLLGKPGGYATQDKSGGVYKTANYVRSGHWSEKARDEARMYCHVHEVNNCPDNLYFDVAEGTDWDIDPAGRYIHYTAADTRQGFEFQEFPYELRGHPGGHAAVLRRLCQPRLQACRCVAPRYSLSTAIVEVLLCVLCRVLCRVVNFSLCPQISRSTG
eukprot:COSAG02_NODE_772_length_17359_cov_74.661587_13_plen_289_part_00